ncbi:MAG: GFA family protein [Pseudomonadota bacterium]|nr:GFA family protein [Pseudomonadota bacterium]
MSDTHIGTCHCGTVAFRVTLDSGFTGLRRCNCSICRRKGAIMGIVPKEQLEVFRGEDNLTLYQWNMKIAKHYFCSSCGIYTHHQRRADPMSFGFNLGCLEGVDQTTIGEIELADGASFSVIEGG